MFFKLFSCAVLLVGVYGRAIVLEEHVPMYFLPDGYFEGPAPLLMDEEHLDPIRAGRERRQLQGNVAVNSDFTSSVNMKLPITGDKENMFSAIGGVDFDKNLKVSSGTVGVAYDHVNGHSFNLAQSHLPHVGDRTTAAGTLNLFHDNNHNLEANAFAARTTLNQPALSFNTVGGGLDYMYNKKVGAGVSIANTPMFDKTDYAATGNLNLFRNPSTSLDFKAGVAKSVSPYIPRSSWEPNFGFTFKKFFF